MQDFEARPAALATGDGVEAVAPGVWKLHGQGQSFVAQIATQTATQSATQTGATHGDALLLVDAGPGGAITRGMIDALRSVTSLPLAAIVFSHGHLGYNSGLPLWLAHCAERGDPAPRVIAHANVLPRQARYRATMPLQEALAEVQFRQPRGRLAGKLSQHAPTETFAQGLTVGTGPRRAELLWAPSETDDAVAVWLPEARILYGGPAVIDSIPNIGTPLRTLRDASRWARTLENLAALEPERVVREFGADLCGAQAAEVLRHTASALHWLHDEVIRLINQGMDEREMLAALRYPEELFGKPWMRPSYGDPSYIARDIYRAENGWWDRNATSLHPAPPEQAAAQIAEAVSDHDALIRHAQALADKGEIQLALHVIDVLAGAPGDAPTLRQARELKAGWLRQRSRQVASYVSRSLYVACADSIERGERHPFSQR